MSTAETPDHKAPELRLLNLEKDSARVRVGTRETTLQFRQEAEGVYDILTASGWTRMHIARGTRDCWWIHNGREVFEIRKSGPSHSDREETHTRSGEVRAPTPGKVVSIMVKPGNSVEEGDRLIILESMKTEQTLVAQIRGKVQTIAVEPNQQVLMDEVLLTITPEPKAPGDS